ncbi:MAG: hypothetical protein RSE58_13670 [Clostridia bacterium]
MNKVMRFQIADYLGVKGTGATPEYHLMNVGFTAMNESPSPKVSTQPFIGDKNASSDITGYENSFSYDTQLVVDEEAIRALLKVAHDQLTGEDAIFDYVRVDLYDAVTGSANTYKARKFKVCVEAGDISGDPADVVTTSGTLHQIGDLVQGSFSTATKTFTEAKAPTI